MDAAGCHRFSARAGDVIVTAGHRIAPFEVESVLMLHEDVTEAVVVGVPTTRRGTVPEAYVVLRPGAEPAFGLADELQTDGAHEAPGVRGAERGARRRRAAAHSRGHGAAGCAARAAGELVSTVLDPTASARPERAR